MHPHSRLTKISGGVYVDENPQATPCDESIEDHYERDALRILEADQAHYAGLRRELIAGSIMDRHYTTVADVAGGHPKLASCLDCDEVTVYDRQAETYRKTHAQFLELYPDSAPVGYVEADITSEDFAPYVDLAVYCHVLEHLTIEQMATLIKRVDSEHLLIYGPNVDAATSDGWFHYAPKDHITFLDMEAMMRVVWYGGYRIEFGTAYHEDYIMYGVKR